MTNEKTTETPVAVLLRVLADYDLRDQIHGLGPEVADAYDAVVLASTPAARSPVAQVIAANAAYLDAAVGAAPLPLSPSELWDIERRRLEDAADSCTLTDQQIRSVITFKGPLP